MLVALALILFSLSKILSLQEVYGPLLSFLNQAFLQRNKVTTTRENLIRSSSSSSSTSSVLLSLLKLSCWFFVLVLACVASIS